AGLMESAIVYWQLAGERAIERSAHVEAVMHLSRGLEVLQTLPDTPQRAQAGAALADCSWPRPDRDQRLCRLCSGTHLRPRPRVVSAEWRDTESLLSPAGPVGIQRSAGGVADGAAVGRTTAHARPDPARPHAPHRGPSSAGEYVGLAWRVRLCAHS